MPQLRASATLSRVVSREKFGSQRVTSYVVFVCVVAACGGLLFGYSLAITGGLGAMEGFVDRFFAQPVQQQNDDRDLTEAVTYCQDANLSGIGFYTSSLFLAGAFVSPLTYWFTHRMGRRASILMAGVSYLFGGVLQTAAVHVSMLYLGRVFTGVAVSFANQSVPVFLSEMAPPKLRGALSMGFQFAVTLGILLSQILTFLMNEVSAGQGWRYALALSNFPAVVVLIGGFLLPDTPNSLVARGLEDEGRRVLQRIRGADNVAVEFMDIVDAASNAGGEHSWHSLFRRDHRPQLVIAVVVPVVQQLTGANAVLFYAPLIFETTGASTASALLRNVILGATNVLATALAVVIVDRAGRRVLLLEGLAQMLVAMAGMAAALASAGSSGALSGGLAAVLLAMVLVFFTGYAWSWAGLAWVIPNEVQPLDSRATGQAVAVFCNFLATFVVGQTFPVMLCAMEWGVYLFYGGCMVLGGAFTALLIPETKGLGIEDIYFLFTGHWFWSCFFSEEQKESVVLEDADRRTLGNPGGRLSTVMSRAAAPRL